MSPPSEVVESAVPDSDRDTAHILVRPIFAQRNRIERWKSHLSLVALSGPNTIFYGHDSNFEWELRIRLAHLRNLIRGARLRSDHHYSSRRCVLSNEPAIVRERHIASWGRQVLVIGPTAINQTTDR
jgi:hypothetical protein